MAVRWLGVVGMLLLAATASAQGHSDTVHLKDGTAIRGSIIERVPDEWVRIRTSDGSVYVCDMEDVLRLTVDGVEVTAPEPVEYTPPAKPTGPRLSRTEATLTSLAGGLFLVVDGSGQFINGEKLKAVGFAALSVVALSVMIEGGDADDDGLVAVGAGLRLASYVLAAAEANWSAGRINRQRGHTAALMPPANRVRLALNPTRRGRGALLAFTHRM